MYHAPEGRPRSVPPVVIADAEERYHSDRWYEVRKSAEFRKNLSAGNVASYRAEERRTRALAKRLNQTESGGVWLTPNLYGEMAGTAAGALADRARRNGWPRRDGAGKRIPLYLVPHDVLQKIEAPAARQAPPAPRPWWRRLFAWLGL